MEYYLNENLVNFSNSILKHYNCDTYHDTLIKLDELLKRNKNRKIVLFLFDGFGRSIYEKYKEECPYLYSQIYYPFYSIYPPTTVAATDSLLTGLYPLENGFVGWNQYIKEYDDFIDVFLSKSKKGDRYKDIRKEVIKPTFITDIINKKHNKEISTMIHSFEFKIGDHNNFDLYFKKVDELINKYEFIYAYSTEPDHTMHLEGVDNDFTRKRIKYLNDKMEEITKKHKDTLFLLISDHGFMDIENIYLEDDKELLSTLEETHIRNKAYFTIEGRFASFFVKDETKFKEVYNKKYKDKFVLLTKDELLNLELLGPKTCKINKYSEETLGNYFFLSNTKYNVCDDHDFKLKGAHAGITKEEMEIYLTVFNDVL